MIPKANSSDIDRLRASADIIEEVDGLTTYLGFCKPGTTQTSDPVWSIMKITVSGNEYPIETTFLWANGYCSYNLAWDYRYGYNYAFKKF